MGVGADARTKREVQQYEIKNQPQREELRVQEHHRGAGQGQ